MAASRSKRSNAGARMAEVMESDARDPFYASVYGGFYDEATDEDYKCTARAAPKKKKEDGSGPSGEKKEEGAEEDGVSEEGSDIESEADSDADDGAEEDEEKEEAKEEEKEPEQENETKSLNENKNETKSINENGKTEPCKTIEEPSPKKVKLSEAES